MKVLAKRIDEQWYADELLALEATEAGFIQSMTQRANQLPKEAFKTGIETFLKKIKTK